MSTSPTHREWPAQIVTGGQTGVDRAALDAALAAGVPIGGWCPRGRRAEDGPLPARYPLRETHTADYAERTRRNVRDSDATLILYLDALRGGTALTAECASALLKPCLCVQLDDAAVTTIRAWLHTVRPRVLNIAGPRESETPGIYQAAAHVLTAVLRGDVAEEAIDR